LVSRKKGRESVLKRFLPLSLVALALATAPAFAEIIKHRGYVEGGAGFLVGDSDDGTDPILGHGEARIESSPTIGARFGGFFTEHFGMEGQVWYSPSDLEFEFSGTVSDSLDIDIWGFDASIVLCPNPSGKYNFLVLGGIGYLNGDIDLNVPGEDSSESEDSTTLHVGAAVDLFVTDDVYIRPDARYLYVEGFDLFGLGKESRLDLFTISVNVGLMFGK
jgi:opacity protein-like surface antigen